MGTNKGREEKIRWMIQNLRVHKDEKFMLRVFCVRFSSTMFTAKEILGIVKDQKLLDKRLK